MTQGYYESNWTSRIQVKSLREAGGPWFTLLRTIALRHVGRVLSEAGARPNLYESSIPEMRWIIAVAAGGRGCWGRGRRDVRAS